MKERDGVDGQAGGDARQDGVQERRGLERDDHEELIEG